MSAAPAARPVPVVLRYPGGEVELHCSALDLAAGATASHPDLSRSEATAAALRQLVTSVGAEVSGADLASASAEVQRRRRAGGAAPVVVWSPSRPTPIHPLRSMAQPAQRPPTDGELAHFASIRSYPDSTARQVYESLVGLDTHKTALLDELELILYPDRVLAWAKKHHSAGLQAVHTLSNRVPLVVFQGDVGTGKTALAESVGDALARRVGARGAGVHLLKLATSVRGQGLVGQMSDLIGAAFKEAVAFAQARPSQPVILLLDEADALASSREADQMHHEDRGGVNTLIQQLDNLRSAGLPIAAFFITNRPGALDPAVRRRAALDLTFARPGDDVRRALFADRLPELQLDAHQLDRLVHLTGADGADGRSAGFTASDIADRLLGNAIRTAYTANAPLTFDVVEATALALAPTPPFTESGA